MMAVPLSAQTVPGQEQAEPGANARFRWGFLRFTPGIAITDVGIDNNIFNSAENPVRDSTAAIGPAVNAWMHFGALRVSEKSSGQYLYFKENASQRSWNTANELKLELPLARIKPFAVGSYLNAAQREGYEIDARARASTNVATLGSDFRLSGKTTLVLSGTRANLAYDQRETFLGSPLAQSLNRHTDGETAQIRYGLTPLTTFVFTSEAIQDRFDHERFRNADSFSVRSGFEFKPFALISGKASVGFRHFNVLSDAIQDYQGVIASVDTKYLLTTTTQITTKFSRDLAFSYDDALPYYALNDLKVTVTQRLASSWDIVANGGRQSLGYRGLTARPSEAHTDTVRLVGFGFGYLVGETVRIGIDVNSYTRRSAVSNRDFNGVRAGASITYGMQR
jgi:hypothetical protein